MHIHRKLAMESLNLTSKLSQKLNPIRACVFTNKIERSNDDYDLFQLSLHRSQLDHAYHDEYDTISKRNQEKIVHDYLRSRLVRLKKQINEVCWAVFMAGPIGVGKSYLREKVLSKKLVPLHNPVVVDMDEILSLVHGYRRVTQARRRQHNKEIMKECGLISELITSAAIANGHSVVIDGCLKDSAWAMQYFGKLRALAPRGLSIAVIHVSAPFEAVFDRVQKRNQEKRPFFVFGGTAKRVNAVVQHTDLCRSYENLTDIKYLSTLAPCVELLLGVTNPKSGEARITYPWDMSWSIVQEVFRAKPVPSIRDEPSSITFPQQLEQEPALKLSAKLLGVHKSSVRKCKKGVWEKIGNTMSSLTAGSLDEDYAKTSVGSFDSSISYNTDSTKSSQHSTAEEIGVVSTCRGERGADATDSDKGSTVSAASTCSACCVDGLPYCFGSELTQAAHSGDTVRPPIKRLLVSHKSISLKSSHEGSILALPPLLPRPPAPPQLRPAGPAGSPWFFTALSLELPEVAEAKSTLSLCRIECLPEV